MDVAVQQWVPPCDAELKGGAIRLMDSFCGQN